MVNSSSHLLVAGISLLLLPLIGAFPGGVGGCAPNRAAVEGPHLSAPARQTGPIGAARLQMVLDDQYVFRAVNTMDFTIGQDHTLTLRKLDSEGKSFRGFLFRLGPGSDPTVDTTDALDRTSDANTTVAFDMCIMEQGVGGLGHTNSRLKDSVTGILRMDVEARNMPLDVTVVIQNNLGISEFYYQQFLLNAVTTATGIGPPAIPNLPTMPPALPPGFTIPPDVTLPPGVTLPPDVAPAVAPVMAPTTMTPEPPTIVASTPGPVIVNEQKVAPAGKCDSLASIGDRGGAAAQAKDCTGRVEGGTKRTEGGARRKLKGSSAQTTVAS